MLHALGDLAQGGRQRTLTEESYADRRVTPMTTSLVGRRVLTVLALVVPLAIAWPAARQQTASSPADAFDVRDVMIPARDGVKLHTKIFSPKNQPGPLPILMRRTPYGIEGAGRRVRARLQGAGRRGLHLRVPGHPREVRVRRPVRHAAPGPHAR